MKKHYRRPIGKAIVRVVASGLALLSTGWVAAHEPVTDVPVVTVAVSTSMPLEHVRALAQSLAKTGGRLVVRGAPTTEPSDVYFALPPDKQAAVRASTREGLAALARLGVHGVSVAIDPAFFRRHGIDAVPVVVVETKRRQTCDTCNTSKPKHDASAVSQGTVYRVRGDVTLAYALRTLVKETTGRDRAAIQSLADRLDEVRLTGETP